MERLKRFFRRAGYRSLLLIILVGFIIWYGIYINQWYITIPAFGLMVLVTYLLRDFFVQHVTTVHKYMSYALIGIAVIAFFTRQSAPREMMIFNLIFAIFIGGYVGIYFWTVSDERVIFIQDGK